MKHKCVVTGVLLICMLLMTGCGNHELENRKFPLAIGIEKEKEQCKVVFNFPDLSEVADEKAKGTYQGVESLTGDNLFAVKKAYEKSSSRNIDFSHNKVLILSEEFLTDEDKLQEFIEYTKKQDLLARNTYLFVTKMPLEELFSTEEDLEKPFGTYIQELLESDGDVENSQIMTLGRLYDEKENQMETLYIPILGVQEKKPTVVAEYVLKRGKPIGEVAVQSSIDSAMIQGDLKQMAYEDKDGTQWLITHIKSVYSFDEKIKTPGINIHVSCRAEAVNQSTDDFREVNKMEVILGNELKSMLKTQIGLGLDRGYDITNSYKKLSRDNQKRYQYFMERPDDYEEAVKINISVVPDIVNTK